MQTIKIYTSDKKAMAFLDRIKMRKENLKLHVQNHQLREENRRLEQHIKNLLVHLAKKGEIENAEGEKRNNTPAP